MTIPTIFPEYPALAKNGIKAPCQIRHGGKHAFSRSRRKGALGQKLVNGADSARMSYRIGTINTAAPIDIALEDTRFTKNTLCGGIAMMRELELRNLIDRIPQNAEFVAKKRLHSQLST